MADLSFQNRLQFFGFRLSKSEQKIAAYIVAHPEQAASIASQELAQAIGTSNSTLTRFCKKLEGSGQRIVHKVHTVQVQVLHVCDQHSIHFLLVEGCIQRHIHLCKRIMTKQVEFQQVLFQRTV